MRVCMDKSYRAVRRMLECRRETRCFKKRRSRAFLSRRSLLRLPVALRHLNIVFSVLSRDKRDSRRDGHAYVYEKRVITRGSAAFAPLYYMPQV